MALGFILGDLDSAAKAFTILKIELDKEKTARKAAQIEVDTLAQAVKDLKISAEKFATQIPTLEDKVKHLENKVVDGLNEVRAWELCLECTTWANDDYKKQNTQLINKLESKFPWSLENIGSFLKYFLTNPALAYKIGCQA
jgi:chromosome segregation ATPase